MTLYTKLSTDFTENYIGYSALAIIVSTCLGSIAIMATLMNGHNLLQMFMVFLSVVVCSAHNAAILTVQKPKVVFDLLVLSVITNLIIFSGNMLF
ncbi:hypothetical protein [Aquimarina brevivitae]|uniref:Uncharacterized protein n=1 Tax=Aquimarina brevivitae TaxID=323412 RepID=A0A4V2F7F9_9FLAO|nr:hypothetical protein [Aquimarina brevivitae]RZS99679.1 hypothetical protein EV197_0902 [Aquimarina brevivitae]